MKRSIVMATLVATLAAGLVAGCGQKGGAGKAPAGSGEVLPGTVSDAMIDLDHSRAEAPLAAPVADKAGTRLVKPDVAASTAAGDSAAAAALDAAPEPATPAPAAADKVKADPAKPKDQAKPKPAA